MISKNVGNEHYTVVVSVLLLWISFRDATMRASTLVFVLRFSAALHAQTTQVQHCKALYAWSGAFGLGRVTEQKHVLVSHGHWRGEPNVDLYVP